MGGSSNASQLCCHQQQLLSDTSYAGLLKKELELSGKTTPESRHLHKATKAAHTASNSTTWHTCCWQAAVRKEGGCKNVT